MGSRLAVDDLPGSRLVNAESEIKEVLDGDPHTDTKKLSGNARVNEKVQKKRVKGDPTMTLIPRLSDEKSIEYEVVEMSKDHEMPLIFGRSFMATVGAVVDMPNKRVSFSNINKKVFYKAVPTRSKIRYASCISVVSGEQLEIVAKKELGKKGEIKAVLDGDPHTDTKKLSGNARVKEKVQKKMVKGDPMMTLIPRKYDEKSIEYEVKCKGTSKPFSKVRVILTHELREKGEAVVKGLLSRVLKLNIDLSGGERHTCGPGTL
ncbi:hypothetical protein F2Q70_00001536 [Brassica cretica]|uniref:Uncharacterized protein n=1 Tax=Brassica cretica TaxID=69181 RepID=A0A8S9IKZ3_BRACR|nr:hypothetical protein F2Q70_00001536 [Brassica cretica]